MPGLSLTRAIRPPCSPACEEIGDRLKRFFEKKSGGVFLAVFLITGGTGITVYAGMNRDATLSHITNTPPGELGGQFLAATDHVRNWPARGITDDVVPINYGLRDFLAAT
jgi:hypothetical protein